LLAVGSGVIYATKDFKYGLDVKGGVRFRFKVANLKPDQVKNLADIQSRTLRILENRVTGFGVVEATVQAKERDQFIIEIPGYTDANEARKLLQSSASIKFYQADNVVNPKDDNERRRPYDIEREEGDNPRVVFIDRKSGDRIEPLKDGKKNPAYLKVIKEWGLPILEGVDLANATYDPANNGYQPRMNFSAEGSRKMYEWSRRHRTSQENIAAVLDDIVLSLNPLAPNTTLKEHAVISGSFPAAYVRNLRDLLNAGALPVDLEEVGFQQVQPTIGKQALDLMVQAGLVAFALTALYLIVYYAFPGFVALIALVLYVLFTLTMLKLLGATFSLAAIAGFILSVGMAVDANILVFERFKEEMKGGRSLKTAIELGFRRALPAIVDSNACTILTSLVLANLGTGPVKGFAVTLIIGVAVSLFTAVTVTRSLLMFLVGSGLGSNPKMYALERNWFGGKLEEKADTEPLQIVNKSKKWFLISLVSIVVGLPFIFIGGLKPNVEFQGGYEVSLSLKGKNLTLTQISDTLRQNGIDGANVKLAGVGDTQVAMVTVPPRVAQEKEETEKVVGRVAKAAGFNPAPLADGGDVAEAGKVGEAVRVETIRNAILGVVLSIGLIIIYLGFRFGVALGNFGAGLRFGFSAIGALLHDVLFVVGVTALVGYIFNWEISALFITSMLTVIGFSVHDTIVIFDRMRENLRKPQRGEDFANLVNRSITQSFARSINTSITVIATLIILLVIGTSTPDLKLFVVTMLAGILSGTYSSIYNASPILYLWDKAVGKKKGEEATFMGMAAAEAVRARAAQLTVATEERTARDPKSQSYGQVKRRTQPKGHQELDDEDR
jgi:SecD/SecF fusion protein